MHTMENRKFKEGDLFYNSIHNEIRVTESGRTILSSIKADSKKQSIELKSSIIKKQTYFSIPI